MLDFAIFAVTFLLALVAAVLYLYPVTTDSALWGSGHRPGPRVALVHVFLPAAGLGGPARGGWFQVLPPPPRGDPARRTGGAPGASHPC